MRRPLYSILIPSRNRLPLLRKAVDSVVGQEADVEIIIADNASRESYAEYVASLGSIAEHSVRSEQSLTVTENWNRALAASRGDYVIMLGDDDALAPGWLAKATAILNDAGQPDVVYAMAYHYAYPGVVPSKPRGYFATVDNSVLFRTARTPYALDRAVATQMARSALKFRHRFSFNAQHFVWKREFIDSLAQTGSLFAGPYPDYYAAIVTMLRAQSIIVVPSAEVIVGISPKSFGFFYNNREFDGGEQMLGNAGVENAWIAELPPDAQAAIELPGSAHTRSWLLSALLVARNLGCGIRVDLRRYRRLQFFELLSAPAEAGRTFASQVRLLEAHLEPGEREILHRIDWFLRLSKRLPVDSTTVRRLFGQMGAVYTHAIVTEHDIGNHETISDAWRWLAERGDANGSRSRPPAANEPPPHAQKPGPGAVAPRPAFLREMETLLDYTARIEDALYRPSQGWATLSAAHARQLQEFGAENFKRSVNQNYSNWIPASSDDNQFANVARFWAQTRAVDILGIRLDEAQLTTRTALTTADGRARYGLFVGMLWNYTRSVHRNGLTDVLAEPVLGNPLRCALGGRIISQDLANSIRERNVLLAPFEGDLARGEVVSIVEIGAGYGRLGYVLLSSAPCRYTIVDIAPALTLSQWYLTNLFPAKRAFRFRPWSRFEDVQTELDASDIRFLTPDQFARLPANYFDIGVTINSLSEMTHSQVEFYLGRLASTVVSAVYCKERIEHANGDDAVTLRRADYVLPQPWRLAVDEVDAVADQLFERLWVGSRAAKTRPLLT